MAQPTNTFSSFDAIGNREDLSNIIAVVEQTKTPFMSSIAGETTATQRFHEWQTDVLDSASAANAVIEGDDVTGDAVTATVRVGNRIQISEKSVTISDVQNIISQKGGSAGRNKEMAYQVAKQTKAIKRDMEAALLANNTTVVGNDTTASELGGLPAWLTTNVSRGTGGSSGGFSGGIATAATDGTQRALSESLLKTVLKTGADNGAEFTHILAGAFNKQQFSTFSGGATREIDAVDKKVVNTVDFYVGDFGEMQVMFSPQSRDRDLLLVDKNMVNVAFLDKLTLQDLAKTGATEKKFMRVHYTLEVLNEKGCGVVADLTTS